MRKIVILACVVSAMAIIGITAATAFAGALVGTPVGPVVCPQLNALAATPAGAVYDALCK